MNSDAPSAHRDVPQSRLPLSLGLVILAKQPQPGLAKTRLIPALGAEGAARLATWLLRRMVQAAIAARLGPVELCLTPAWQATPTAAALPPYLWPDPALRLHAQVHGDLGERMADALQRTLQQHEAVLLMGSDAPALDAAVLQAAAAALHRHEAVLVPAHDGGYALIGLRRQHEQAFDRHLLAHMPWSTDQVFALQQQRLQAAGLRCAVLPALHDIDTPDDLCHVPPDWLDPAP